MSKAYFEIEMPESCRKCDLREVAYSGDNRAVLCILKNTRPYIFTEEYTTTRHPECPLIIKAESEWRLTIKTKNGMFELCSECSIGLIEKGDYKLPEVKEKSNVS